MGIHGRLLKNRIYRWRVHPSMSKRNKFRLSLRARIEMLARFRTDHSLQRGIRFAIPKLEQNFAVVGQTSSRFMLRQQKLEATLSLLVLKSNKYQPLERHQRAESDPSIRVPTDSKTDLPFPARNRWRAQRFS